MYAMSVYFENLISMDNINFDFNLDNMKSMHTFGIYLGMSYSIVGFSVGIVSKSLNVPKIVIGDSRQSIGM